MPENVFHVLTRQIGSSLNPNQIVNSQLLTERVMGNEYKVGLNLTPQESDVLIGLLEGRTHLPDDSWERTRWGIEQARDIRGLLSGDPKLITELESWGRGGSLDSLFLDPDKARRWAGLVLGLDSLARMRKRGDLRGAIGELPEEVLAEMMGQEAMQEGGPLNFQDPERGAQDLAEAIDKWRVRRNRQLTLWVPRDTVYSKMLSSGSNPIYNKQTQLLNGDRLVRPREVYQAEQEGVYGEVLEARRRLLRIPEKDRRLVGRLQTQQLVVEHLFYTGGDKAYLRVLQEAMSEEGLDGSTLMGRLPQAYQKLHQYTQLVSGSTEGVAPDLARNALDGVEVDSILKGMRSALIVDQEGVDKPLVTEIGAARGLDIFDGDYGEVRVDVGGNPLYSLPKSADPPKPLSAFTAAERLRVVPAFDSDVDPLRPQRVIYGHQYFTKGPLMREEEGKGPWYKMLVRDLKNQGLDMAKVARVRNIRFDNNSPLERSNVKVQEKILEAGGDNAAGGEYMLQQALLVSRGGCAQAGLDMKIFLRRVLPDDVGLRADVIPELDIKSSLVGPYSEKYTIHPWLGRRLMETFLKSPEAWKAISSDPLTIAIGGKEGYRATWRAPLNADEAPYIIPVQYHDEVVRGKKIKIVSADGSIEEIDKPLSAAEKIKRLEGKEKKGKLSDDEGKTLARLRQGTKMIEMILYTHNDWRTTINARWNFANEIVAQVDAGNIEEAERVASIVLKDYLSNPDHSFGPGVVRNGRQKVFAMLSMFGKEERENIADFNFKEYLRSMGYENMDLADEEYNGYFGLLKAVEIRSSMHFLAGEIDKFFKYISKYPEMAVSYGKALAELVPAVNNAITPLVQNMLGGLPDRIETLSADQLEETMAKIMLNLATAGVRKQGEAAKYVEEIAEVVMKLGGGAGYLSGKEQRKNLIDIILWIDVLSEGVLDAAAYDIEGVGAHGELARQLEIGVDESSDPNDPKASNPELIRILRQAGFTDMWPDRATGKKPYVAWGTEPMVKIDGKIDSSGWSEGNVKTQGLRAYGHRGKETLTSFMLLMIAKDRLQITESDMEYALVQAGHSVDVYRRAKKKFEEGSSV